jgi:hypothetical protein
MGKAGWVCSCSALSTACPSVVSFTSLLSYQNDKLGTHRQPRQSANTHPRPYTHCVASTRAVAEAVNDTKQYL